MSRSKKIFHKYLTPVISLFPFDTLRSIAGVKIFLPFYHAVAEEAPSHMKYLFPVQNPDRFIKDLDFLVKKFKPVSLEDLIKMTANREKPSRAVFHLTFDDGLREFHDIVAPILKQKGIPATCFLNSGFIDNKALFYRFKASLLIDRLRSRKAGTEEWCLFHQWELANDLTGKYYRKVLLDIGYPQQDLLDELATAIRFNFSDYLKTARPYMTSEEIKSLIKQGFTFGAHSIDHPEYFSLSEAEQITQTEKSIEEITEMFSLPYKAFSFPFTDYAIRHTFFQKLFDKEIADITFGSAGIKGDSFARNLQRVPVENYSYTLPTLLKDELFYSLFLKMLGKYEVKR